jgi:hypothetical protein
MVISVDLYADPAGRRSGRGYTRSWAFTPWPVTACSSTRTIGRPDVPVRLAVSLSMSSPKASAPSSRPTVLGSRSPTTCSAAKPPYVRAVEGDRIVADRRCHQRRGASESPTGHCLRPGDTHSQAGHHGVRRRRADPALDSPSRVHTHASRQSKTVVEPRGWVGRSSCVFVGGVQRLHASSTSAEERLA